jgi:hypothetical protein
MSLTVHVIQVNRIQCQGNAGSAGMTDEHVQGNRMSIHGNRASIHGNVTPMLNWPLPRLPSKKMAYIGLTWTKLPNPTQRQPLVKDEGARNMI